MTRNDSVPSVDSVDIGSINGGTMSGPIEIIMVIAVVCYILIRRLMGEPAEGKRMLLLPAILTVVGIVGITKLTQTPVSVAFLAGSAVVSMVLGLLRGTSIRLFPQDGLVFIRYTWVTVALWVANLALKFGANIILRVFDPHDVASVSSGLYLTLGAGMLCEGVVVLVKALRTDGRIMWAKGKKGQPHTMSPFLDALQSRITGTDMLGPDAPPAGPQDRPGRDALPSRPADTFASLAGELVETSRRRDRGGHLRDRRDRRQRRR
jgi:hypothetical protein